MTDETKIRYVMTDEEVRRRPWKEEDLEGLSPEARATHLACPTPGVCFGGIGVIPGVSCPPCERLAAKGPARDA